MTQTIRTTTLAMALTAASALAQTMPRPIPPYSPYEQVKAHLSLTEAQLEGLRKVTESRRSAESAIYDQVAERQREMYGLLQQGSNDAATIGRLMVEINNLQRQLPLNNGPYRTQAMSVLTEAQKTKLPELEQALRLTAVAHQAVDLNLLDRPAMQAQPRILPSPVFSPSAILDGEAEQQ